MPTQLSEHFTLEEFLASQTAARESISNEPTPQHLENLKKTAETMEKIRAALGNKPIFVSSGYRSAALNAAVGGSTTSAHCSGLACDFSCPAFGTPEDICRFLQARMIELGLDQLINEYPPHGWVHIGLSEGPPRHMALTIDNTGTRYGIA